MRRFKRSLRGLAVDDIFDLVWRTERQISLDVNDSQPPIYRRIGSWLVQTRYLNSFQYLDSISFLKKPAPSNVRIPDFCLDLSPKGALKFISAYVLSNRLLGRTSAEAIRIKNNIRTFYINVPLPFSSKILFGKTRSINDMKREIEVRSRVSGFHTVRVPRILQYDLDNDPPFFCEEIISGRKADPLRDGSIISKDLCPQLWQTYERQGITFKKIQDVIDSNGALKKLEKAIGLIKWNRRWCDRKTFFQNACDLLQSNFLLPCSTGHGDLSPGNMIVTPDGQVYIVDWECAKEMPIIFDLYAILKSIPQSRHFFESRIELLRTKNEGIQIPSFRAQCFLSVLVRISQWRRSQKYLRIIGKRESALRKKLFNYFDYANCFL